MPKILVEFNNVSKSYGNFKAVSGLSLKVLEGDVYGFLGPNGSGKSTSLRMLLGLIKPDSGEIKLFGEKLSANRNEILRQIGCIIEKPDFYLFLSGRENLKLFASLSGIKPTGQQLNEILLLVGLDKRGEDKVKNYSHGMKQRLGLAQALIHNPRLIILDEPNTGLDPQGIIDMRQLIIRLQKDEGKTIILSSHILYEIELIANRMIILNHGNKISEGTVSDLLSDEDLVVTIEVNDAEIAKDYIYRSSWKERLTKEDKNEFSFRISREEIPVIQAAFSSNGIQLFSIQYRKQLEDYFLKITH